MLGCVNDAKGEIRSKENLGGPHKSLARHAEAVLATDARLALVRLSPVLASASAPSLAHQLHYVCAIRHSPPQAAAVQLGEVGGPIWGALPPPSVSKLLLHMAALEAGVEHVSNVLPLSPGRARRARSLRKGRSVVAP